MKYGDLTYEEIQECASQRWLAIVPTGCTEQQGPHLPVDFDTWFVEHVTLAASGKAAHDLGINSLVLPVIPFGPTPEHRNFGSGYIDIPSALHQSLVYMVLKSLVDQNFRCIIVWRGCGGHDLSDVVNRFNNEHKRKAKAYLPSLPYSDIWNRIGDPSVSGGHADSFATSIALHLRPDAVRVDKITKPKHRKVEWSDPNLDFSRYSSTGVIGDPTHASAELGAKLWDAVVEEVTLILRDIAESKRSRKHNG